MLRGEGIFDAAVLYMYTELMLAAALGVDVRAGREDHPLPRSAVAQ